MSILLANLAVGFLSGGIAGALGAYALQRLGRVTCVVSEWSTVFLDDPNSMKRTKPKDAGYFEFDLFLDFFNTKAVDTGIRGLCVRFRSEGGETIGASPLSKSKGRPSDATRVASINLPANSLTSMKLYGHGNKKVTKHVAEGGKIEVFGYFPNKKEFCHPIDPRRDAWSPIVPMDVRASRERGR